MSAEARQAYLHAEAELNREARWQSELRVREDGRDAEHKYTAERMLEMAAVMRTFARQADAD